LNIRIVILITLIFAACQFKEKRIEHLSNDEEISQVKTNKSLDKIADTTNKFSTKDITWNEGLNLELDYDIMKKQFPSVYTSTKPDIYDMLNCDSIAYINKSEFEKCEPNSCRLLSIEFDDLLKRITIGQKTIDQNTTRNELANMFNECEIMKELSVYGDTTSYTTCLIMSKIEDFGLHVFSSKGKIIKVEIWEPS